MLLVCFYSIKMGKDNQTCPSYVKDTHIVVPKAGGDPRSYNLNSSLLFIGGVPKSGTTLLRVMLDAHPGIRCGPESHIFIDMLKLRYEWTTFEQLTKRNTAAGVTRDIINKAVAAFLLEVTARHGEPADMICTKEPFLMTQGGFLAYAFPNARIIHVVRDGRAVSHSLVSRRLNFPPFSPENHKQNLKQWAKLASGMEHICKTIGRQRCMTVRYEDLVQDPADELKKILAWLGVEWDERVLQHHQMMDSIVTSKMETTADQIGKPVYRSAVDKWKGNIPQDVLDDELVYAPTLRLFGYGV